MAMTELMWWNEDLADCVIDESELPAYAREYFRARPDADSIEVVQCQPPSVEDIQKQWLADEIRLVASECVRERHDHLLTVQFDGPEMSDTEWCEESERLLKALIDSLVANDINVSSAAWQSTGVTKTITRAEVEREQT
jgi:hypothetical protein